MFYADCDFRDSEFLSETNNPNFYNVTFDKTLMIDRSKFKRVPDFRMATFRTGISIYNISVNYYRAKKSIKALGKAIDQEDSDRYRKLKELAGIAKDHEREQVFFAYELKAKRFYETKGGQLLPNLLYGWFSNYGQSYNKTLYLASGVWILFAVIYSILLPMPEKISSILSALPDLPEEIKIPPIILCFLFLAPFSVSQILPFMGSSKVFARDLMNGIDFGNWVYFCALGQNLLGLVLIFLIVLALRNRFKLKT